MGAIRIRRTGGSHLRRAEVQLGCGAVPASQRRDPLEFPRLGLAGFPQTESLEPVVFRTEVAQVAVVRLPALAPGNGVVNFCSKSADPAPWKPACSVPGLQPPSQTGRDLPSPAHGQNLAGGVVSHDPSPVQRLACQPACSVAAIGP